MKYWLINRDPYIVLLQSPYNWVGIWIGQPNYKNFMSRQCEISGALKKGKIL